MMGTDVVFGVTRPFNIGRVEGSDFDSELWFAFDLAILISEQGLTCFL